MANTKPRGDRPLQEEVLDRCQALLLRLMRGPATTQELIAIVETKAADYGEDLPRSAIRKRFEEDRRRIRQWFNAEIIYERGADAYTLIGIHRPWIDLPDDALRGLAFLKATFSKDGAVMQADVLRLIEQVQLLLSQQRRRDIDRERGLIEARLTPRDEDDIPDGLLEQLGLGCSQRRHLEFDYLAASNQDDVPRRHLVEPLRCFFDEWHGHYYLQAFNLETTGPKGRHIHNMVRHYRVGRIRNVQVLPTHFPEHNRRLPRYELVYELSPQVARRGVTRHFPESVVHEKPDGSATVHAISHDLFFDLRRLLHYGANCRVIGGEAAVREMKRIVKDLYERYQENDSKFE